MNKVFLISILLLFNLSVVYAQPSPKSGLSAFGNGTTRFDGTGGDSGDFEPSDLPIDDYIPLLVVLAVVVGVVKKEPKIKLLSK
ncbi:MAG: hypothetical protein KAG96_01565 [Ichthyobacteriaceae bacterium]|nr:hypothetical protein [Ichthyobacteriaceae bacterium]